MAVLIFIDCEGHGPAPGFNDEEKFEFGAVAYNTRETFHGKGATAETFRAFERWLAEQAPDGRPVMVTDNVAYDWQFINVYCWRFLGYNPLGHSARRIGDYYAGLTDDFRNTQPWKKLRITRHDHNPVNDALGNLEAFERIARGER